MRGFALGCVVRDFRLISLEVIYKQQTQYNLKESPM